jgi:regulatory protein
MSRGRAPVTAWWKAQELLARRAHGTRELIDKLRRREFPEKEISEAIARLEAKGLLNDRRYAAALVEELFFRRGWGWYAIIARLRRRGLEKRLCEEVCAEFFAQLEEDQLRAVLERLLEKRKRRESDFFRLYAWLKGRGFRGSEINLVLGAGERLYEEG